MNNNIIKLLISTVSAIMLFGIIALASDQPTLNITVDKNNNSTIEIEGLTFDVYSVQLELTVDNSDNEYEFTPNTNATYSFLKQDNNNSKTNLTVYLDSKSALSDNGMLEIGSISSNKKPNFSNTGNLILLNEKLRPTTYNNININVDYSQVPPDDESTTDSIIESTTNEENSSESASEATTDTNVETTTTSTNGGGSSGGGGGGGGGSSSSRYKITAEAGEGGSIDPKGEIYITSGENKTFKFVPNKGYKVLNVKVNDLSVEVKDNTYTINNIKENTKIVVTFAKIEETKEITQKVEANEINAPKNEADEKNFSDVNNHWAKEAIYYLFDMGIVNGITEDTFAPNNNITRAEFVTLLAKTAGIDIYNYSELPFNDVNKIDWFAPYVAWAFENKIVHGIDNETFAPKNFITREQMAVMISNFADFKKITLDVKNESIDFKDKAYIAQYAANAVEKMQTAGIINGRDDQTFAPKDNTTRAESAMMIYNLIK